MMKKKWFVMLMVVSMLMFSSMGVLAEDNDIVDTAIAADDFNTLVAAVVEANLVDALRGEGPFTVFAPTDAAFAALLAELGITAAELLASDDLASILLYHVVAGKVMSTDLVDGLEAETLNGQKVIISLSPTMVNDSNIIAADIETSNGVIHVIDAVLLPVAAETPPIPKTGSTSIFTYILIAMVTAGALVIFTTMRTRRFNA